jgi:pyruvate dehydrogenase E1 component beta subunit
VLNTPNSENTLVGIGFGLMLKGVDGIFFMKQLDFLLLGLDQLVNSYNIVRRRRSRASFTMMCIVVDSGYEGPQSRLNTLGDFSSMANVPAYTLTNYHDSAAIIERHLVAPGCRIIAASQRLFREEPIRVEGPVQDYQGGAIFRYANGAHATIACFNFAFPQGHELRVAFTKRGQTASLFSVNGTLVSDWSPIVEDVRRTGCLVVLDDSRSTNRLSHQLQLAAVQAIPGVQVVVRERAASDEDLRPHADSFKIDYPQLLGEVVK